MKTGKLTYLPPNITIRNIRSKPFSFGSNMGIDVGDAKLNDEFPVFETLVNTEGTWYLIKIADIAGWILGISNSITYVTVEETMEDFVTQEELDLAIKPPFTHRVKTTSGNGVKLRAYPKGAEAAMLKNLTPVRLLDPEPWKGQKHYAAYINKIWVAGWMDDIEVQPII